MNVEYRAAAPEDAAACMTLRGMTRENAVSVAELEAAGITPEKWAEGIRDGALPGYVCVGGEGIAGYCFGDRDTGEVVVLALLPEYEGRGIGKTLLGLMTAELSRLGHRRFFLGCATDPAVRSYGFYRHLGWRSTGTLNIWGDEVLELFLS